MLCVSFLVILVRSLGGFQEQEWETFDWTLRHRIRESPSDRIVILGINEQDLDTHGGFPVPDDTLAEAIETLQTATPRVIGLDLFRGLNSPPSPALMQVLSHYPNIVGIDVALNSDETLNVPPPPGLPAEQVGFADALIDGDGKLRRLPLASRTWEGLLRYSFAFTLAYKYLERDGYTVHQGPSLNASSSAELHSSDPIFFMPDRQLHPSSTPKVLRGLKPHSGGYVGTDAYGHQLLLNFCSHPDCYPVLSLSEVLENSFDPALVEDRIILIGMTAPSVKDTFVTAAVNQTLFSKHTASPQTANRHIYGIELHAHALHHLLGNVLDQRPSWRSLPEGLEYLWILVWSVGGFSIGLAVRSPWVTLAGIGALTAGLAISCYGLMFVGWWLPFVPTAISLVASGLTTAFFDRDLRILAEQRRLTIEQTFEAVHNGPLQSLAVMSREVKSGDTSLQNLATQLDSLNQELRGLYAQMGEESLDGGDRLYLNNDLVLDVRNSLPELLNQIFTHTLERPFPGFKTLRFCITPDFSPLQECLLSPSQKRGVCLFFEEALCNVGKHALNATRLEIKCTKNNTGYSLSVSDNSPMSNVADFNLFYAGQGTKQAKQLAQDLKGKFERIPNQKRGVQCKLTWPVHPSRFKLRRIKLLDI